MNYERWVDPRIRLVRVADARAYLRSKGWQLKPFPRPQLLVFEGPANEDEQASTQVLPASESSADYQMRCVDLITNLSVLEDRHPVDILNDILNQHASEEDSSDNGAKTSSQVNAPEHGQPLSSSGR